jgi:hypothetical protein
MAGALTISTLNNDTGVLATQNRMSGIAKAWVNLHGTGTVAIRESFNVSSITDNGTGDYTINFTTAMPNANYCIAVTGHFGDGGSGFGYGLKSRGTSDTTDRTASACRIGTGWMGSQSSSFNDLENVFLAVFSS